MTQAQLPKDSDSEETPVEEAPDKQTTEGKSWLSRHTSKDSRRLLSTALATAIIVLSLVLIMTAIPVPYVIESPGPTFNVLGAVDGKPVIELSNKEAGRQQEQAGHLDPDFSFGAKHPDSKGELRAVTVGIAGGPGRMVNLSMLLQAWLNGDNILDEEEVYPKGVTAQQIQQASSQQMKSSQYSAEVAALQEVGYQLPTVATVSEVVDWSDAKGKLENGDVLVSLTSQDGTRRVSIKSPTDTKEFVTHSRIGEKITIEYSRAGKLGSTQVEVKSNPETHQPAVGILYSVDVDFPVDIQIQLGNTGGPSAGVMFALGIIDRLTKSDITGGQKIAGTGALTVTGDVQDIGGVNQKIRGALRDGAKWFLLPEGNCKDVVNPPSQIRLVPIKTLAGARKAVKEISTNQADSLPTCPVNTK